MVHLFFLLTWRVTPGNYVDKGIRTEEAPSRTMLTVHYLIQDGYFVGSNNLHENRRFGSNNVRAYTPKVSERTADFSNSICLSTMRLWRGKNASREPLAKCAQNTGLMPCLQEKTCSKGNSSPFQNKCHLVLQNVLKTFTEIHLFPALLFHPKE